MDRSGAMQLAGALVLALLFASVPAVAAGAGGAGGAGGTVGTAGSSSGAVALSAQSGTPTPADATNNSTVQHENPETVDEEGDLDAVTGWLAGRMAQRLQGSTLALSEGEYDRARQLLGDGYDDQLARFVDVAGDTDGTDDDDAGEALQAAQTDQREYTSKLRQYRRTLERYREARQAGDTAEARRIARELDRSATSIVATGRSLRDHYTTIENRTGTNLSRERRTIERLTDGVSDQQADIRDDLFVETTLQVRPRDRDISFRSPLVLEGRLRAANGTTLADRQIALQVGNRTLDTRTDEHGTFVVGYRPIDLPTGEQSIAIRYRPQNASVYLGDRTNVTVRVESVAPALSLDPTPATARYGDALTLSGSVRVDTVVVPRVPVAISLDGRRLGTAHTGPNGTFALQTSLPADVTPGDVRGQARVAFEDRAIARTAANASIRVRPTATRLSLDARPDDGQVAVTGRLVTDAGRPVSSQSVTLLVNGSVRESVATDGTGRFDGTVTVPDRLAPAGNETAPVRVTAVFQGDGTSLNDSREQALVTLTPPANGAASAGGTGTVASIPGGAFVLQRLPSGDWLALGSALVVVIVGLAGSVLLRRRRDTTERESDPEADPVSHSAAGEDESPPDDSGDDPGAAAIERLEAGDPDAAVELAYLDLRGTLETTLGLSGVRTHWEFLDACAATGLEGERLAALETITETYEQAVFAPASVDPDRAQRAVDLVASARTDD